VPTSQFLAPAVDLYSASWNKTYPLWPDLPLYPWRPGLLYPWEVRLIPGGKNYACRLDIPLEVSPISLSQETRPISTVYSTRPALPLNPWRPLLPLCPWRPSLPLYLWGQSYLHILRGQSQLIVIGGQCFLYILWGPSHLCIPGGQFYPWRPVLPVSPETSSIPLYPWRPVLLLHWWRSVFLPLNSWTPVLSLETSLTSYVRGGQFSYLYNPGGQVSGSSAAVWSSLALLDPLPAVVCRLPFHKYPCNKARYIQCNG
jgi:hypothetical protein